jgi:hypothetical protein
MALKRPKPITDVPSVHDAALELAADVARGELTKFRFKLGGCFVILSVLVWLAGDLNEIGAHFRPGFPSHAWTAAKALFFTGLAFAGKEIIEGVINGVRLSLRKGDASSK